MADPAMEHHCLKGFPDIGELRTIWKKNTGNMSTDISLVVNFKDGGS